MYNQIQGIPIKMFVDFIIIRTLKEALCSFVTEIQIQNINIYNIEI